ncbi:MAG: hypothetical protein ACE5HO_07900 [bacterium]
MRSQRKHKSFKALDQHSAGKKEYVETREDYLVKGYNGLESAVIISDEFGSLWGRPKSLERGKVKSILSTLNERGISYAIIGGIAMGQHALPRTTHDLDILVAKKDIGTVRKIFKKYYKGGSTIVQIYDVDGTRLDVLPADLRHRIAALEHALDSTLEGVPIKVVDVRSLLILKILAVPERTDLGKKRSDEADITELLKYGKDTLTKKDIDYVAKSVLAMGYTKKDVRKYHEMIQWLNETLELLDLGSLKYPLEELP